MARWYTDEEKATALAAVAAQGGNVCAAARACGIGEKTVRQWLEGQRDIGPRARTLIDPKKSSLDNILTNIAHEILNSVPGRDWETVPPVQCMTAAAIAIDKALLLRGEPGEIIETRRAVGDELAAATERMTPDQRDELAGHLAAIDRIIATTTMDKVDQPDQLAADVPLDDGKPTDQPTAAAILEE